MYRFEFVIDLKIQVIDVEHIEQLKIPDRAITAAKFMLMITVVVTNLQSKDFPYHHEMLYSFYNSSGIGEIKGNLTLVLSPCQ